MSEKDAGPGDVRNDDPDRQNRVDAGRHQDDGHNILISNFDRYRANGHEFVAAVDIIERYRYTPVPDGYHETVLAQGDRDRVRAAVARALDYARQNHLPVQVNNPHVLADIAAGDVYNLDGIEIRDGGA